MNSSIFHYPRKFIPYVLFVMLLYGHTPKAQTITKNDTTLRINTIQIERANVFPGDPEDQNGIKKAANRFHIVTKENVIRRELLFKEGDLLDAELIAETERRLRSFSFLGKAEIEIDTVSKTEVVISVSTEDQWSLIPSYIIESGGGLVGVGGSLEENNLFGNGKGLYAEFYNESDVGTTWTFSYYDPRLFGTKWRTALGLSNGPLNQTYYLSVYRPYFYSDSKWTYGFDGLIDDEVQRIFQDGKEVSRLQLKRTSAKIDAGYAFGKRYKKKRLKIKYRVIDRDFSDLGEQTTTPVPEDELIASTSIAMTIESHKFAKETHIDKFQRIEDITIGRTSGISIGRAGFPVPVGVKRWEFSTFHSHAFAFNPQNYLFTDIDFRTWVEKNTVLSLNSQYFWQPARLFTFAMNVEFAYAWDLEEHRQFVLGGDSGLRGYKAREFGGDKLFLTNMEGRFFPSITFLTIEMGTIVFVDAGYAWSRVESLDFSDLRYSTGFGFRFAFTKVQAETVARLDFGWPINQAGGMQITFGVGQHF